MPRKQEEIEADIGKESALWQASGNRLDALRRELKELDTPPDTGESKAAELKVEVDKAIEEYGKAVASEEPTERPA